MTMTSKTVLITGATSGIGAHTARLLLDRGHRVAVTGRDGPRLKAFLDETGHADRLLGLVADAADWQATESAVARTVEHFGALDAAVANAGFMSGDCNGAGDPTRWAPMVLTNVLGPALLAPCRPAPLGGRRRAAGCEEIHASSIHVGVRNGAADNRADLGQQGTATIGLSHRL
jgi:NAD(P)-dependent dehydrogenase (short-subunit alcohol dehydrogenase family)